MTGSGFKQETYFDNLDDLFMAVISSASAKPTFPQPGPLGRELADVPGKLVVRWVGTQSGTRDDVRVRGYDTVVSADARRKWLQRLIDDGNATASGKRECAAITRAIKARIDEIAEEVSEQKPAGTTTRPVRVSVARLPSLEPVHPADRNVEGSYRFLVPNHLSKNRAKEYALDRFHANVPIKVLDDFDIVVLDSLESTEEGT